MKAYFLLFTLSIFIYSCIGTDIVDDLVDERLEITNPIMSLKVGESYELIYRYLNHVGDTAQAEVIWKSENPSVITVNEQGNLLALDIGTSMISVVLTSNDSIMDNILVEAADETVVVVSEQKSGTIATTSSYELSGDFDIENVEGGIHISIADNYVASEALPGLYVYLSNNPTTVSGALEIGEVTTFSGAHTYDVLAEGLNVDTYAYLLYFCKPFNVKVGHGEILD